MKTGWGGSKAINMMSFTCMQNTGEIMWKINPSFLKMCLYCISEPFLFLSLCLLVLEVIYGCLSALFILSSEASGLFNLLCILTI